MSSDYEVGKYYYNNLSLIKVESIDASGSIKLKDYDDPVTGQLLDIIGYYELPVADPEG